MVVHATSFHDNIDDDDPPSEFDLHSVAKYGKLKELSKLLKFSKEYKVEVDAVDEKGRTALMEACRSGQGKAIEYLLQAGACADLKDNDGYAAVHHSVFGAVDRFVGTSRAASGLRALAKYRVVMDRKTVDGFTAGEPCLHLQRHVCWTVLHTIRTDLSLKSVHLAVKMRATDMIGQLKSFGCDIDKFSTDGVNAIYLACHTAAEDKTVSAVLSLLQLGARIDKPDPNFHRTALHKACDEELSEIARFLVLSKASVVVQDKYGDTPLHICARRGSVRTLEVICQALTGGDKMSHDPDREKEDLEKKLEAISDQADAAKIKSIMSITDTAGNTPLHVAVSFGFEQYVLLLLRQGADPGKKNYPTISRGPGGDQGRPDKKSRKKRDVEDDKPSGSHGGGGKTAYHIAAEVGHTEVFKTFIRKGIDTSGVDEFGHTCLHYAAMNNDVQITELQLECDPNPNVQTLSGWTPLHYAAVYDSVHVIVFLLDAQGDPSLRNNQGHTPLMMASRTRTKRALEGLLRETLKREAMEKEQRDAAAAEDRKRMIEQMDLEALQRRTQKVPLLDTKDSDDEQGEEDPLARVRKEETEGRKAPKANPDRRETMPSSARSGTGSTKAHHLQSNSPRSISGAFTARTTTSKMSIRSHPPPKDQPWERWRWEMKRKWGPILEEKLGPVRDKLKPLWNHPTLVKGRKRLKYLTNRFAKRVMPTFTGFTSAPATARSQLTSFGGSRPGTKSGARDRAGGGGVTARTLEGSQQGSRPNSAGSQRSVLRGASPAGTPRSSKSVQFGLPSSFAGGLKMPKVRIPMSGKS